MAKSVKDNSQSNSAALENGTSGRRGGTKRITVDLPRDEHRFLRDTSYDLDTDGMRIMRALLLELRDNPKLFERVEKRLAEL